MAELFPSPYLLTMLLDHHPQSRLPHAQPLSRIAPTRSKIARISQNLRSDHLILSVLASKVQLELRARGQARDLPLPVRTNSKSIVTLVVRAGILLRLPLPQLLKDYPSKVAVVISTISDPLSLDPRKTTSDT